MFEQIYRDVNLQIDNPQFDFIYKPPRQSRKKSHYLIAERGLCQHDLLFYPKSPNAEGNMNYIYVIVDMMKPYRVDAEVIRNKRNDTIINAFRAVLARRIVTPRIIWSDPGTEFNNAAFQRECRRVGVEVRFTVPGRKTQNAVVEMMNGYLRQALMGYNAYMGLINHRRNVEVFLPKLRNFVTAINNYFEGATEPVTFDDLLNTFSTITDYDARHMYHEGDHVYIPRSKNGHKLKFRRGDVRYRTLDFEPEIYVITRVLFNPAWSQERYLVGKVLANGAVLDIYNVSYQRSELLPVRQ